MPMKVGINTQESTKAKFQLEISEQRKNISIRLLSKSLRCSILGKKGHFNQ